jgi:hypothetical protein
MNLEELHAKRDARIKAKKERIKLDSGTDSGVAPSEVSTLPEEKK